MKNLRLHKVSIHRIFYQYRLINEYAREKKAKISESQSPRVPESQSHGITELQSFLVI